MQVLNVFLQLEAADFPTGPVMETMPGMVWTWLGLWALGIWIGFGLIKAVTSTTVGTKL